MPSNQKSRPHTNEEQSDETLMRAVSENDDSKAFGQLSFRWHLPIQRLCYRMVGSWQDAEDLTQEVFTKLFFYRHRYRQKARFSSYVWRIAINQCNDFLRSRGSKKTNHDYSIDEQTSNSSLLQSMVDSEAQQKVRVAVGELPAIYRTVLVLKHYEQLKIRQIADVLEIPIGTVASRLAKALDLLREHFNEQFEDNKKTFITEIGQ